MLDPLIFQYCNKGKGGKDFCYLECKQRVTCRRKWHNWVEIFFWTSLKSADLSLFCQLQLSSHSNEWAKCYHTAESRRNFFCDS